MASWLLKRVIGPLAILSAAEGCGTRFPLNENYDARAGLEYVDYNVNLGKKIQTTPVHPDDSSYLTGETTTNLDGGSTLALNLGIQRNYGPEKMRFFWGLDLRSPFASYPREDTGLAISDNKQQVSDTRPPAHGSFVFTQLKPYPLEAIPFVGLERLAKFDGFDLYLSLEAGLPYTGFRVRSGHDRFGQWDPVQRDSWSGFGKMLGGRIGLDLGKRSHHPEISLELRHGSYDPEFGGEDADIETLSAALVFSKRF